MPSKTTPFCFVFQGKLYINTGNGKDFLGIQNEDSSQLCFLFVRRSVIPMVCGLWFFFLFRFVRNFFSTRRGKRSCQVLVQDEDQCFLLSGLTIIVSKTDLLA